MWEKKRVIKATLNWSAFKSIKLLQLKVFKITNKRYLKKKFQNKREGFYYLAVQEGYYLNLVAIDGNTKAFFELSWQY